MKKVLQLEELFQFAAAVAVLYYLPVTYSWWLWVLLFFAPDISMVGYLVSTRAGAVLYNVVHHKALALVVAAIGWYCGNAHVMAAGGLLYAHSAFDRVLGYGLKYGDSFQHTHLGTVGNNARAKN